MNRAFPVDFVRQTIEQTLLENHLVDPHYIGGENQVSLFSFYEQLVKDEEVNRYVERYRDLCDQQNRSGIIANGVIVAPENPTITNLYQATIIPMTFTCSFRCTLKDRDIVLQTINKLINDLKGTKVDIAELDTGKLIKVGTIGYGYEDRVEIVEGDYLFKQTSNDIDNDARVFWTNMSNKGIDWHWKDKECWYVETRNGQLAVITYDGVSDTFIFTNTSERVVVPSEHKTFKKWKLSLSFESIRCDEPRTLNAEEYCMISFGGSATLVNENVLLGNDLVKLGIKRNKVVGKQDVIYNDQFEWLEPLEMPSANSADTQINQLLSNKFITNTHTDSLTISNQYSFILDLNHNLIKHWFEYGRYGIQDYITPNIIYDVREIFCYWGNVIVVNYLGKIIESIDIENTESDTMSIVIPMQIQGENN